jgi:hypothetical protein
MPKGKLLDNYKNGKIYRLLGAGITDVYVGSTCGSLDRRLWFHNYTNTNPGQRQMSAAQLYQRSPSVTIELLEDYPCKFKDELVARERYWMEKFRAEGVPVVNVQTPTAGLTEDEIRIRRNNQKNARARANLYHCPCGRTIQSAQKEDHLASRLHAKRLSSLTPSSSSTSPDTSLDFDMQQQEVLGLQM